MKISRLISPFGELVLKRHPLFNDMPGSTTATWASMGNSCAIIDPANIKWRPLKNSDTKYIPDTTPKGIDGDRSEWMTEGGFEFGYAESHYWIEGLTSPSIDT